MSPGTPSLNAFDQLYATILCLFCASLLYLISVRYRHGLKDIPGPFWASILPFDRIVSCARGHQCNVHIDYHQRYGLLVRVGPNHVSFADGDAISTVYSIATKFQKSDYYRAFDVKAPTGPIPTVFSIRDEASHRLLKRPVASAYSMGTMVDLEPVTDVCIKILERKLDGMQGEELDFGMWLHWFAWDVITSTTFSNRLGFMEQERDVDGIIEAIEGRLMYNSTVGQAPALHHVLLGNRFIGYLLNLIPAIARLNKAGYIASFAAKQLARYQEKDKAHLEYRDMLDRFKRQRDGVEIMSDKELLSHSTSNVFAGSDTTAISLRSMFYYLCKTPASYEKLIAEIDALDAEGKLSDPIAFGESNQMPYLQACMREAMRLHPAVGMLLERFVPAGGVTIAGKYLSAGTIVGANPWVVARDKGVYGDDTDVFRPERWLEAGASQLKLMERNYLAFGAGSRTCLGKNISLLEMNKLVPQILRNFEVELAHPEVDWQIADYWFVKQTGLICRVRRRAK